jgi:thioredoxin reductase/bacterioferritin-associated ferredoxin
VRKFDAVIIGAGPAGMSAAVRARAVGLEVAVVDEQPAPGGQVWRGIERSSALGRSQALGPEYVAGTEVAKAFRNSGAAYFPNTSVWQLEPRFRVYTREGNQVDILSARMLLIATGAVERAVPFRGWTLPGVLTAGAAQILLKSAGQIPDAPVWIAGSGPLMLLYANQLLDRGGRIAGMLDTRPAHNRRDALPHLTKALACWGDLMKGARWISRLRRGAFPIFRDVTDIEAMGDSRLEAVRYRTAAGVDKTVPGEMLLVHEGVVPDIQATLALDCRHEWNEAQQAFAPVLDEWGQTTVPGVFVAGDGGGIGGVRAACAAGENAALGIAQALGKLALTAARESASKPRLARARALALRPFLDALYRPRGGVAVPADDVTVCRCEEVTAGTIRAAARAGAGDPNQVKAATRCGMGPCLGRVCSATVSAIVANATAHSMSETGVFRVRPPLRPVTLAQLAALEGKKLAA